MKLIRFGEFEKEKPGVIMNDKWLDVSEFITDYDERFFEEEGLLQLIKILSEKQKNLKPINKNTRLGPPVARPSKIICIGFGDVACGLRHANPCAGACARAGNRNIYGPICGGGGSAVRERHQPERFCHRV